MKRSIIFLLLIAGLLPTALAKKEKKVDPRLKSIHSIFVKGKEDSYVRMARQGIEQGKCFQLAADEQSADGVLSVMWSAETKSAVAAPNPYGGVGGQPTPLTSTEKINRSTLTLKAHEGNKLKKVWSDSMDLSDAEEGRKSGVLRLVEKLSEGACSQP